MTFGVSHRCLHCGHAFASFAAFSALPRVTSDCKPFAAGGEVGCCAACGLVQKPITESLLAELAQVYRDYTMFSQASGCVEQAIFSLTGDVQMVRSVAVVKYLQETVRLRERGMLLDVGSGTGSFLTAFACEMPGWRLFAQDRDDRYQPLLSSVPSFEKLYVSEVEALTDTFDVISLSHVLEHLMDPIKVIRTLARRLNPGGVIVIQVPDLIDNVFDLAVCDHVSHYTAVSLAKVAKAAGFSEANIHVRQGVVSKQLTMFLSLEDVWKLSPIMPAPFMAYDLEGAVDILCAYGEGYRHFVSQHREIAIFGVAMAATWFFAIGRQKVAYFVDEDKNRIGRSHLGIPVVALGSLPKSIPVFVGLAPPALEESVCRRMAAFGLMAATAGSMRKEVAE